MPGKTSIEWSDVSWNPVTGCTQVSAGCDHCYALTFAERWRGVPGHPYEQGFDLKLWPERLAIPLTWRQPRRVFVNSMSDLFHVDIPSTFISDVFAVMALAHQHTFQVLTKRPRRMHRLLTDRDWLGQVCIRMQEIAAVRGIPNPGNLPRPIGNVWLGTSVEDQAAAYRIDWLIKTPAAVRFLSCEPLLGPLELYKWLWRLDGSTTGPDMPRDLLHWVIAGAESGHGARPMDEDWVRDIRRQCVEAGVAFFYKQNARNGKKISTPELDGRAWTEFPLVAAEVSSCSV